MAGKQMECEKVRKFEKSMDVLKQSLKLFKELDSGVLQLVLSEYAFALNHMGTLHFQMKNNEKALEYFRESQKLFEQLSDTNPTGSKPYVAMTLGNISAVYIEIGEIALAEENLLSALHTYSELIEKSPNVFIGTGLKLVLNLKHLYEMKSGLSQDEAKHKIQSVLTEIFGRELTDGFLKHGII